ncbi:MAG: S41 family peptidase [Candidatus Omnitrophota bacterium]
MVAAPLGAIEDRTQAVYDEYVAFFNEVYKVVDENYFFPVSRENFDNFIQWFNKEIYNNLNSKGKSSNYIKWRSAAYMIDYLKNPDDRFSAFFPPKDAKKFEEKVLGKKINLGIEGRFTDEGYFIVRLEPRSDAYKKGLRVKDIITQINSVDVLTMTEKEIAELLMPLEDTMVRLAYIDAETKKKRKISVTSKEYFRQSVFLVPVDIPGIYCLEIRTFNRKTSEDMFNYLSYIEKQGDSGLILDLRGNPGGPPLAACEISSFFLPPNEEFAYFQKKGQPKAMLSVPKIPTRYHYEGPIAILVNQESGSASELFAGVLQKRKRAVLIGKNTAGQVFLKSMFHFDDDSMVLLVTARGHHPDGEVFDFSGLVPNEYIDNKEIDLIRFAATYLKELDPLKRKP